MSLRFLNLYAQLMAFVGHPDPVMRAIEPATYAASCRYKDPNCAFSGQRLT